VLSGSIMTLAIDQARTLLPGAADAAGPWHHGDHDFRQAH
jgi:hypothetical protein